MNPSKAIHYKLSNDATITSYVGTNIFQVRVTQEATYPAIMIQKISDVPYSDDEGNNLFRARIQVNVYAADYNTAHNIALRCLNVLDFIRQTTINGVNVVEISIENETDLIEDYSGFEGLFHVAQDYMVVYQRITS